MMIGLVFWMFVHLSIVTQSSICITGYYHYNNSCYQCLINCQMCYDGNECKQCDVGFSLTRTDNKCGPCDINCEHCQIDGCKSCKQSWGLLAVNNSCVSCKDQNCTNCKAQYDNCLYCINKYVALVGQCKPCISNCDKCANQKQCLECEKGYGLKYPQKTCQKCKDNNCEVCTTNFQKCTFCKFKWGVDNSQCRPCFNNHNKCLNCSKNLTQCFQCQSGFGVQINPSNTLLFNKCSICYYYCQKCGFDRYNCSLCQIGFGLNQYSTKQFNCFSCKTGCKNCSDNYDICTECKYDYGLSTNITGLCLPCSPECKKCSIDNYQNCTECNDKQYLSTYFTCQPCMQNCSFCESQTTCETCQQYFFFNDTSSKCQLCPPLCTYCIRFSPHELNCTNCQDQFTLRDQENPARCADDCGDFFIINLKCDNDPSISYDGCNYLCYVQQDFNCTVQNNRSICSYEKQVQMKVISINDQYYSNSIEIVVQVFPPLYVFATSNISSVFKLVNEKMKIESIKFDRLGSQFSFVISYSGDVLNEKIQIQFLPSVDIDERYHSSVSSSFTFSIAQLYYQPELGFKIAPIIKIVSYVIMGVSWASVGLGIGFKRLAGIELMMVIQILWSSIIWMNSILFTLFKQVQPIKYATDYDQPIFSSESIKKLSSSIFVEPFKTGLSQTSPHSDAMELNTEMLCNSFNISLFIQTASVLFFVLFSLILACLKSKMREEISMQSYFSDQNDSQSTNKKKIMNRIQNLKQISAQLMLTFGLINLGNFMNSIIIYCKINGVQFDLISIIVLVFGLVNYAVTIFAFICDAHSFGNFRYSFRPKFFPLIHYYFYTIMLITVCLLLAFLPQIPWSPIVAPGLLLLFTVLTRPYKQLRENMRACICLCVILIILSLRIVLVKSSDRQFYFIYFSVIMGIVLLLSVLTLVYLLFDIYSILNFKQTHQIEQKQKVMFEFDYMNIRDKMILSKEKDGTYNKIIMKQMSIYDFSKKISKLAREQDVEHAYIQMKQRNEGEIDNKVMQLNSKQGMESGRKLRRQMQCYRIRGNKEQGRNEVYDYNMIDYNKEILKMQRNVLNNFNEYLQNNKKDVEDKNDVKLSQYEKNEKLKKQFALDVAVEENRFVNVKTAQHVLKQFAGDSKDKNKQQYIVAYDQIE